MYFLEQCLHAVFKALSGIESEVIVVDNNSVDGSVKMLQEKFPLVKLISNKDNRGFSKANNQGIALAQGEYVLLLNPDTVVENDTFSKAFAFMDSHADAGGLGVKMLDGKGNFLPESKRGLPTPSVAFYKMFGLSKLFPKSKTFGRYHLGFLDKEKIHEVEILSGAFMLLRKKVLDITGPLDEAFFMYGEDIDMSYRIIKAGYKNYYFPETRIIHYKGESTKKSSLNYVLVFYNAMMIFVRKHFTKKSVRSIVFFINLAIYLHAAITIIKRFVKRIFLPLIDAAIIFLGIFFIKGYWEHHIIFPNGGEYPLEFITIAVPVYIVIWLLSVHFSGGYDKPVKLFKILQGILIGSTVILIVYALLSESYRFSRALILISAVWAMITMSITRLMLHLMKLKNYRIGTASNKRIIVIGNQEEAERVATLLKQTSINPAFIGLISVSENSGSNGFIGSLTQVKEIIGIYKIDEVIFCAKDLAAQDIIAQMSDLQSLTVDYKIAPPESLYIIGSNSINTSGDLYVINVNSISKYNNKRNKRLLDLMMSFVFLCIFPVNIFIVKKPFGYFRNIFAVLFATRSWIGYADSKGDQSLPQIKKGILNPVDGIKYRSVSNEMLDKLNLLYARDYKLSNDLNIILKGYRELGRKNI